MTPLERVARALADYEVNWQDYMPQARAVITALREPSEAMTRAGIDRTIVIRPDDAELTSIWRDMIDAALAE